MGRYEGKWKEGKKEGEKNGFGKEKENLPSLNIVEMIRYRSISVMVINFTKVDS